MGWGSIRAGERRPPGRSRPWQGRAMVGACSVLLVGLMPGAAGAIGPAGRIVASVALTRVGVATAVRKGVVELGTAPVRARVALEIALRPRDPASLARAVEAVSNPASALYRHYLAKGQFGPMFGPTRAAVAAVSGWLSRAGLRVGPVFDDDL